MRDHALSPAQEPGVSLTNEDVGFVSFLVDVAPTSSAVLGGTRLFEPKPAVSRLDPRDSSPRAHALQRQLAVRRDPEPRKSRLGPGGGAIQPIGFVPGQCS